MPLDVHYDNTKGDPIWLDDQHILFYIDTARGSRFFSMEVPVDIDPEIQYDAKVVYREPDDDRLEGYRIHHHRDPAISPNGKWLAYSSYNYVYFDSLSSASGQSIWVFENPIYGQRAETAYKLTNESAICGSPHWSPDGSKIVFHATNEIVEGDNTAYYSQEIYTIDFDEETIGTEDFVVNNNITRLTFSPPAQGSVTKIRNNDPVYSPDGGIIAFSSDRRAPTVTILDRNIWFIPEDGSLDPQILFFTRSDDIQPTFTGNGREILISSSVGFPTEMLDDLWNRAYARISAEDSTLTEVQIEALAGAERLELENFEDVMHHLYRFTAE
jgi:WD40 repeat protein